MDQELRFYLDDEDLEEDETQEPEQERVLKVRLDKWLWAARFFKTRAIAREAVERGNVYYNGERSKPNREIEIGAILNIRMGYLEKTVEIKGLSTRRRSIEEAFSLFEESKSNRVDGGQASFNKAEFKNVSEGGVVTRERRTVRFLRRSVVRGENRAEKPSTNTMKVLEYEMTD